MDTQTSTPPDLPPDMRSGFVDLTMSLAQKTGPDGMRIDQILSELDERAFGLAILIMAIPCLVPLLYGPPQVLGGPIFLLAGQLFLHRSKPWLPKKVLAVSLPKSWLDAMAGFADKRLRWLETFSKPRFGFLASGWGERMAGLMMMICAVCIVLPMTNTVPSVALALLAVGILQRDGLFVLLGGLIGLAWFALLLLLVLGVVFGLDFVVHFARDNLPWLTNLLGSKNPG